VNARSLLAASLLALPVACAPLIDFDALTNGEGGADAGTDGSRDSGTVTSDASDASTPSDANDGDATDVDAGNPCANVTAANDGYYCGTSHESGFAGGAPNTLYQCSSGVTTSVTPCVVDCITDPPGYSDTCDQCNTKSDGTWCGSEFPGYVSNLANVKFTCAAGQNNGAPIACTGATPKCHPMDGGAFCGT
jgi:hypothetical protein